MSIPEIIFYLFSAIAICAALVVILSNNPVRCSLGLVLAFFAMAGIWLLAQAEFLAWILILVYVGAVMTLFLFVIMMIDIDIVSHKKRYVAYLPGIVAIAAVLIFVMIRAIRPDSLFSVPAINPTTLSAGGNTFDLGLVLYTYYVYAFELAAILLLVAIIAAISLSHRKPHACKTQDISKQLQVDSTNRVSLVAVTPSSDVMPKKGKGT